MRDHTKLQVFTLADDLAVSIYKVTTEFPKEEKFGLAIQMRRAAVSVPCNIVEGCARYTFKEYIRFLDIAYGSARELQYQISLAGRLGYMGTESANAIATESQILSKKLNVLIRSLREKSL